jgi:hypothetical protein
VVHRALLQRCVPADAFEQFLALLPKIERGELKGALEWLKPILMLAENSQLDDFFKTYMDCERTYMLALQLSQLTGIPVCWGCAYIFSWQLNGEISQSLGCCSDSSLVSSAAPTLVTLSLCFDFSQCQSCGWNGTNWSKTTGHHQIFKMSTMPQ